MLRRSWLVSLLAATLAACSWSQYRAGPAHTGVQPFESKIGVGNVASLTDAWHFDGAYGSSAVVGGTVYTGGSQGLVALDAAGKSNCSGVPRTCTPLWSAHYGVRGAPAVAEGMVYVAGQIGPVGTIAAFDAAGVRGCGGVPKVCSPIWVGGTGLIDASPTVADGKVFVGAGDDVVAFDAAGVEGCAASPRICGPVWTAHTLDQVVSAPTVADGVVYAASWDRNLYAYDAAGVNGCTGSPKICTPIWTASTLGPNFSSPAVANGVVYLGTGDTIGSTGEVYAFDADGGSECVGLPKVCSPRWTATLPEGVTTPTIASGTLFVASGDGPLYALDADGVTGCDGSPRVCRPLWTASAEFGADAPVFANGVLYVATAVDIRAFDASATIGCSGNPKVCQPIWTSSAIGGIGVFDVAVVNGEVFASTSTGNFHAFGLPPD